MANRCKKDGSKKKMSPSRNRKDYSFKELSDEKELEMEQLMESMNAAGLGGGMNMYSRDQMDEQMAAMQGMEGMGDAYGDPYGADPYGDMGGMEGMTSGGGGGDMEL